MTDSKKQHEPPVVEDITPRELMGLITEDPLLALPVGAKIEFSSDLFRPNAPAGLAEVSDWDFFDGAVIGLHFGDPLGQAVLGSGAMVAPGVALVAKHVVDPKEPEMKAVMQGAAGFICTAISSSGLTIWRPRHVTLVDNTDLAILTLQGASALPEVFRNATISTRLPGLGEQLIIAGVRHEVGAAEDRPKLNIRMMVATGTVAARYEQGRDWLLPWPTLEVDCPALSGMSGGPAFDERGFLIGLLCTSLDPPGPAYVSLLWPSLATRVTPPWPPGIYPAPVSLLEMDRRLCGIERPDALEIVRDEPANSHTLTYRPWSDG